MDIATLLGLVMGTGVVIAAILVGSDLYVFLNVPGFLIVIGGAFAATLIKFPISRVFVAFKVGIHAAFVADRDDALSLIETHCHDGSCLRRLTPLDPAVALILQLVSIALDDLVQATTLSKQPLLSASISPAPVALLSRLC